MERGMKIMAEARDNAHSQFTSSWREPIDESTDGEPEAALPTAQAASRAIYTLLETGETTRVTFAPSVGDAFEVSRMIAGFANADGGLILFGAQPPATILGCNTQLVERMFEDAQQYLEPNPVATLHTLAVDGKPLAAIKVRRSNVLVLSAGGAFVRREGTIVPMSEGDLTLLATKQAVVLSNNRMRIAAKSLPLAQELEPIVRATVTPLARAIVQQTELIERLHDDLAAASSFENRTKEWVISAVIGALVGQFVTIIFG